MSQTNLQGTTFCNMQVSSYYYYSLNWNTELWLVKTYFIYPIFLRFIIENPIEKINPVLLNIRSAGTWLDTNIRSARDRNMSASDVTDDLHCR